MKATDTRAPAQHAKSGVEIYDIILQCTCPPYSWRLDRWHEGFLFQLQYSEPDVKTGEPAIQHGRKWYISPYATGSEIVQTVLKACLTSAEHRIREHFRYKGKPIFQPHWNVERLVEMASQ